MAYTPTKPEIVDWCTQFIARTLDIPPERVNPQADFESFGLDSPAAVGLVVELEEWLQHEVPPSALFEHPSIDQLAAHLVERLSKRVPEAQT